MFGFISHGSRGYAPTCMYFVCMSTRIQIPKSFRFGGFSLGDASFKSTCCVMKNDIVFPGNRKGNNDPRCLNFR